jgi:hypothetical protein
MSRMSIIPKRTRESYIDHGSSILTWQPLVIIIIIIHHVHHHLRALFCCAACARSRMVLYIYVYEARAELNDQRQLAAWTRLSQLSPFGCNGRPHPASGRILQNVVVVAHPGIPCL